MEVAFVSAITVGEHELAKYKEWPPNPAAKEKESLAADQRCCRRRLKPHKDTTKLPPREEEPGFNNLWDKCDARFCDKVNCKAFIKIMSIDPKNSSFELRMQCHWKFRTQHGEERTETRLRIPGIRMPGLIVNVDESRIWRDMDKAKKSQSTVFWRGISVFTVKGFERFEMGDFPYDRQVLRLDLLEFVWRSDRDSTDHDFSMQICALTVETESMLPEWSPAEAFVHAENMTAKVKAMRIEDEPPAWASRFTVALRVERKNWYYVIQVFGLTILITICSCLPLLMPPTVETIGSRLGLYAGGLLTLTAFKYGVADQLPSVPYSTRFDGILFAQMLFIILLAAASLFSLRITVEDAHNADVHAWMWFSCKTLGMLEDILFGISAVGWLGFGFYLASDQLGFSFGMKAKTWTETMAHQDVQQGYREHFDDEAASPPQIQAVKDELDMINRDIMNNMTTLRVDGEQKPSEEEINATHRKTKRLQARRSELEADLQRQTRGAGAEE